MTATRELIQKIKRIEVVTTKLVEELLIGAWRSAFKGTGIDFEEVREYTPGDDVRTINWNVMARMGRPFVKIFREERELTVLLLVDVSASIHFRHKEEYLAELAATLAFSAIRNQDRVGLLLFSEEVELYLPPRKGKLHILRLIREILAFEPKKKGTDLQSALRFLGKVRRKRALCFILSDFFAPGDFWHEAAIAAKKHDLIFMEVTDPMEQSFIPPTTLTIRDLETGNGLTVASERENILHYNGEELKEKTKKIGAELIRFSTDRPYVDTFKAFFAGRRRK